MKHKVLNLLRFARLKIVYLASKNRLVARLFFLLESSFDREYEFTLRGRYEALTSRYYLDKSNANIRRCVHRLEKGLFHRNRRAMFGRDVMAELAREVKKLDGSQPIDSNELLWAIETLNSYLPHAHDSVVVESCIDRFKSLLHNESKSDFVDSVNTDHFEEFQKLSNLYKKRESVRFFSSKVVDINLIEKAVFIAKEAPSACNRQPFHLHLLTEREDIDAVGGLAPGTSGFLNNIPVLGVLVGHASAFRFTRDRHLIYTDGGLFLGHLLPALMALDLDTCVLNWNPDWKNDRQAVKYLGLDMSKTIVCLLAIGYRDETASPVSAKKTNDNILRSLS